VRSCHGQVNCVLLMRRYRRHTRSLLLLLMLQRTVTSRDVIVDMSNNNVGSRPNDYLNLSSSVECVRLLDNSIRIHMPI